MGKVDQQLALRTGNDEIKVFKFVSAFIFDGILLPIMVAAFGVLNIPASTESATAMVNKLMAAVPNVVGAVGVAVALVFGLGGRDAAKTVADNWASRLK